MGPLVLALLAAATFVVAHPIARRMAVFALRVLKYLLLFVLDWIGWRRFWAYLMNRDYQRMTGPLAVRLLCEDMGPTFVKLAQLVASSEGVFPPHYVAELGRCLDAVRPLPYHEVFETLSAELGPDHAALLAHVEHEPLASASIAQVHDARLADGTEVVIKVQRPGLRGRIDADVKVMRFLANLAQTLLASAHHANPVGIVEDLDQTLHEEIDFRKEAENLDRFNRIMAELGHTDIRAPVPNLDMTTERLLVMERFHGIRVDDVAAIHARGGEPESELVKGLRAWFQCVVFYGFFHGDVHAGNLMFLDDRTIGFLDFGIVGRFDDDQRHLVTDWMIAFAMGNYRRLAEVIVAMGGAPADLDMERFTQGLALVYGPVLEVSFGEVNVGELMRGIQEVAHENDMTLPREFVLITKQLLYFDRYAKLLAPKLNIFKDPRLLVGMMDDIRRAREQAAS